MLDAQAVQQLHDEGYLTVPNAVPSSLCDGVIEAIETLCGADLTENPQRFDGLGIVPLHHHPALWAVRQDPGLYDIFRSLYGRDDLWVTMDRVSYKPPRSRHPLHAVHWDCDPWTTVEFSVQALVYLTDTTEDQGAFACVPSIYRNLDAWRKAHAGDEQRRKPDIGEEPLVRVPGTAGTLVVFHRLMPHTNTVNTSDRPRLAQYVTMHPPGGDEERERRIRDWREKRPPDWAIRQQVPGQQNPEPGEAAPLTQLGRKLVGIDAWT